MFLSDFKFDPRLSDIYGLKFLFPKNFATSVELESFCSSKVYISPVAKSTPILNQ